jgi:hypothetical protein
MQKGADKTKRADAPSGRFSWPNFNRVARDIGHRVRRIIAGAVGFGPVVMIRFLPAGWSWFRGRDPLCRNCWKAFIEFVLSDDERDKLIGQFVFLDFGKSVE